MIIIMVIRHMCQVRMFTGAGHMKINIVNIGENFALAYIFGKHTCKKTKETLR